MHISMESTSNGPPMRSKLKNRGGSQAAENAKNDTAADDTDPLSQINGEYYDFVNSNRRTKKRTEKYKRTLVPADFEDDVQDIEPIEQPREDPTQSQVITEEEFRNTEKIIAQMADVMKKLSTTNAFSNPLIDNLPKVIKLEPLQSVGTMLDASAKIYAYRVDATHQECFIVRKNIGDAKELKKMKPTEDEDENQDIALDDRRSDQHDADERIDEDQPGPSKKYKKPKKVFHAVDEAQLKELQEQMSVTIKRFRKCLELEDECSVQNAEERFEFFANSVVDRLGSRRELVTNLERVTKELDMDMDIHDLDEPFYHKATASYEEGSAQSMLLRRVQTSRDGKFLLLHNKWADMNFEAISQPVFENDEKNEQPEQEKVEAFCNGLNAQLADTAEINLDNLLDLDDVEEFDELLNESVPFTPDVKKKRDTTEGARTIQFEDEPEATTSVAALEDRYDDDTGIGGDDIDVTLMQEQDRTLLDEGTAKPAEVPPPQPIGMDGIALGPSESKVILHEGQPPDRPANLFGLEEEAPEEVDPGLRPVPDDSHWKTGDNAAQEKPKKLDKKKREAEASESGIADMSWAPVENMNENLVNSLRNLHITGRLIQDRRDRVLNPIGDIYETRDNETNIYGPHEAMRMKTFYKNKRHDFKTDAGYYRYRKATTPAIIWMTTCLFPAKIKEESQEFEEFVDTYAKMDLNDSIKKEQHLANVADVTLTAIPARSQTADEDSLVDFNNDSFNATIEDQEPPVLDGTRLSIPSDNDHNEFETHFGTPGELDKTGLSTASQNLKSQATNLTEQEYSDVEEIEINGMEIKIRPSRVKAIVVKKAMKKILSKNPTETKAIVRDGEEVVQDFVVQGTHTIGSLLADMPDYLKGRTRRDLTIVNAFSILLQMCNENNLYLHQDFDEHGIVKQVSMSKFEICNSDPAMNASPQRQRISPAGKKRPFSVDAPAPSMEQPTPTSSKIRFAN